jgi:hypothetical protein
VFDSVSFCCHNLLPCVWISRERAIVSPATPCAPGCPSSTLHRPQSSANSAVVSPLSVRKIVANPGFPRGNLSIPPHYLFYIFIEARRLLVPFTRPLCSSPCYTWSSTSRQPRRRSYQQNINDAQEPSQDASYSERRPVALIMHHVA